MILKQFVCLRSGKVFSLPMYNKEKKYQQIDAYVIIGIQSNFEITIIYFQILSVESCYLKHTWYHKQNCISRLIS